MVHLSLTLSITGTYHLHFLQGKLRGQSILAVGCHSLVHMCKDDALPDVRGQHRVMNKLEEIYQKQVSIKKKEI